MQTTRRTALTGSVAAAVAACLPAAAEAATPQPDASTAHLTPKGPNDQRLWELLERIQANIWYRRRDLDDATWNAMRDVETEAFEEMARTEPDSWSGVHAMMRAVRCEHTDNEPWSETLQFEPAAAIIAKVTEIFARPWLLRGEA